MCQRKFLLPVLLCVAISLFGCGTTTNDSSAVSDSSTASVSSETTLSEDAYQEAMDAVLTRVYTAPNADFTAIYTRIQEQLESEGSSVDEDAQVVVLSEYDADFEAATKAVYGSETAESYLEKLGGSPVLLYTMETVSDPISAYYGSSYAPTKIEYTGEEGQYRYTVSLSGNLVKDGAESAVEMTAIGRVQFKDGKIIMISLDSGTISDYFS